MSFLNGPRLLCLSLALVYAGFLFWHGGHGTPMSAQERDAYFKLVDDKARAAGMTPNPALIEELHRLMETDDGNEFYMLNLINYHAIAQYPPGSPYSGTGLEADARYNRAIAPLLFKHGNYPVFVGEPQGRFIDEAGDTQWQRVALVRYRSRRDLMEMIVDLVDMPVGVHKWASISKTQVFPTRAMFIIGSARSPVALLLALLGGLIHLALRKRAFYSGKPA